MNRSEMRHTEEEKQQRESRQGRENGNRAAKTPTPVIPSEEPETGTARGPLQQLIYKMFVTIPPIIERMNGWCVAFLLLVAATAVSAFFFEHMENPTANIALVYVVAVFFVARTTKNYRYGLAASFAAVIAVNYFYTFPYNQINFTMTGYPMTFLAMFSISSVTSAMITNMKEQAQALQDREKKLMEAEKERMRANLLRAVSHDLRTPLTSIIGSSTVYLENGSDMTEEQKNELIRHIREDSNWLLNMVENLLSVTRINSDNAAKVNKKPEPVEEVLEGAIARLKKRIEWAKVHAQLPDEFYMIPMDAILIEQVLINLMENSIVHSGTRHPIDVTVESDEDGIIFHVRDYGVGIPPERIRTIFDGTTSEPNNTGDVRKGMGIGLSICKAIVRAHDGEIWVRNMEPGAEFSFRLPRGQYKTDEDDRS